MSEKKEKEAEGGSRWGRRDSEESVFQIHKLVRVVIEEG
jgi:hypothetical protein